MLLKYIYTLVLFFSFTYANSQDSSKNSYKVYEDMISEKKQRELLSFIADDNARGRSTGSLANGIIGEFIRDEFISYNLKPIGTHYYQHFFADSLRARNVIGMIPSIVPSDEYIIIGAHYDHIGALNGFVYNGADDNASGVTALLNLAEMFSKVNAAGWGPNKHIIFVAFDAKEKNMKGSNFFVENLKIPKSKIVCAINIDQIGSVLEPLESGREDYVVVLGEKNLKPKDRGKISIYNRFYNLNLEIDYTFYGSKVFTEMYPNLTDQVSFSNAGIPSLLFTSGFHKHSYKISDDLELISYPILKKRTLLIFYFAMML